MAELPSQASVRWRGQAGTAIWLRCGAPRYQAASHFDGRTYGPVPNSGEANNNCTSSYGIDAMRQMIIIQK